MGRTLINSGGNSQWQVTGRTITDLSRRGGDTIGVPRGAGFISSQPAVRDGDEPHTHVTTKYFLPTFEMETLQTANKALVGLWQVSSALFWKNLR